MSYNSYNTMPSRYKTIPLRPRTYARLTAYKWGGASYDDVLNNLMDSVPLERVSDRVLREHDARMKTRQGRDWRAVKKALGD